MQVHLRRADVTLTLPLMPPKQRRGDKRNYLRWHCWVEAVRALAEHYRDDGARPRPRRRRKG